jgi:plasmid stabilization system protein ParE
MRTVRKFPAAEQDLIEIGVYIAQDSPVNADRFIDAIERECQKLADSPFILAADVRGCTLICGGIISSATPLFIDPSRTESSWSEFSRVAAS